MDKGYHQEDEGEAMTIEEVYEEHKRNIGGYITSYHLALATGGEVKLTLKIIYDLWQAVKEYVEKDKQ